jgi:Integron cassette protein VCH_CASS1 chain
MALTVSDLDVMQEYLQGVMQRAAHHAGKVEKIALALAGAITWRKDAGKPIKVMSQNGETKNVLWVYINGKRYAFSYNHQAGTIEMREKTTHGPVFQSFSNATSLSSMKSIFQDL